MGTVWTVYTHPLVGRHVRIGRQFFRIKGVDTMDTDLVLVVAPGGQADWLAIKRDTHGFASLLEEVALAAEEHA